ncbi:MAG: serine protease [Limisphaerales bacterium]
MMSQNLCRISVALGLLAATVAAPCRADEVTEKGREIFKANRQAVVIVELALKNKVSVGGRPGRSAEVRRDAAGTVIDPSGLTVLSLCSTDPAALLDAMMSGREDQPAVKMESELSGVKIVLDDGTEMPAEVVLRDKDADLAFIRPKTKPAAPMAALDLANAGKADVLDQVVTLTRLGSAAGRADSASVERISAIVTKPRLFYVPETSATTTTLGAPAFTLEGKPLGVFVLRSVKGKESSGMLGGMFGGLQGENVTGIILPAEEILKAAQRAPAGDAAAGKRDR